MGEALRPLREDGVLVLASGSATHNLYELSRDGSAGEAPGWVVSFGEWLAAAVGEGRTDDLLDYRSQAPDAVRNHPTEEHLLPLFPAMGARPGGSGRRVTARPSNGPPDT